MKAWKRYLIGVGVVLLLIQAVPLDRDNPPVTQDLGAPPEVDAILRRSCYDCHSNEVRWPWYAYVAPASFVVTQDVAAARHELNLSEWDRHDPRERAHLIEEMVEEADEGHMPPRQYLALHGDAALTDADRAVLRGWARDAGGEAGEGHEGDDDHGGDEEDDD